MIGIHCPDGPSGLRHPHGVQARDAGGTFFSFRGSDGEGGLHWNALIHVTPAGALARPV